VRPGLLVRPDQSECQELTDQQVTQDRMEIKEDLDVVETKVKMEMLENVEHPVKTV